MGTGNLGYSERNDSSTVYLSNEELGVSEVGQGPDNSTQINNLKTHVRTPVHLKGYATLAM